MPTPAVTAAARIVTPATVATVFVVSGGVHGPEAGRCQCGEHLWVFGDGARHVVVPAVQAGVHQLPGVAGIQIRARRAREGAAVVAARQYLMRPAERVGTEQVDRVGAEPDLFGLPPPGLEAR
jgi:hypothetical protein